MSIDAINSLSEAIKVFNNPDTTKDEKRQILAKYPDVVKYVGKDTTQYEISDEDFDVAKASGEQRAKDVTGHDGSTHSTLSTVGTAIGSAAVGIGGAAASLGSSLAGNAISSTLNGFKSGPISETGKGLGDKVSDLATNGKGDGVQNLGDIATIVLGAAVEAKYMLEKPNEEQIKAAKELYNVEDGSGLLTDNQEALVETQEIMDEAEAESTALAEEAEETNKDANEQIDEDKTKFDYYRAQYNELKSKAESGEPLTKEEKALMNKLAPQMEQLGAGIGTIQEETSNTVSDLNSDLEGYQDIYDESAETMADVEGVTEFAEGFDETTKTLCTVEGISHTVNGLGVTAAGIRLAAKGGGFFSWVVAPFVILAGLTATKSAMSASEQFKGASDVGAEIGMREQVQDLNAETTDIYDEKLDTYAGQVDMVGDLELEVPDDLEIPEPPTTTDGAEGGDAANPFGVQPTDGQNNGSAGTRGAGKQKDDSANGKDNDDDKKKGLGIV